MTDTTLTVDQAVAELVAPVQAAEAPEAPVEEQEQPAEALSEDAPEPETAEEEAPEGDEPDAEEDPGQEGEEEAAAIAPPKTWDAEDKAWFATQPPDVQARLLKNEEKREGVLTKAKEKASAEARQEMEGEWAKVHSITGTLREYLPRLLAERQLWWGQEFDLAANVDAHGAETALKMQAQWQAEQQQVENIMEAQRLAEREALVSYQMEQSKLLHEMRPEFADPKSGPELKKELAQFLISKGATKQQLEQIPAWGATLALIAMNTEKAEAAAKAKAKVPAKPVTATVKPSATPPQSTPEKTITQLKQRLAKTGKLEDAVALQLAEQAQAQRRASPP